MGGNQRHQKIREALRDRSFVSVKDLVDLLDASPATVRRDIDKLNEAGDVRKVFGGVASTEAGGATERQSAAPFDENRVLAVDAKRAIAREAERLCRDGDSIIIHGGSTCFLFGMRLARRSLRIFTNSMPLAAWLGEHGTCQLMVAGGDLHREPGIIQTMPVEPPAFYGSKFFIGAQGIGPSGVMESHPLLARSVEALLGCTDEVIVLADSRKFAIRARHVVYPLTRIGKLITDDGLADNDAKMLEAAGVEVIIAARGN
ncbi:DeoR/GlpR family DNA-binding transcription regulator [Methylobrevis pamukkalensis]|uniref:HTH-type transcriptional regulator UlaR n=1 Tax=Methylobrevis pamukkalensis TaxID=1439726 RepID=A0A1E3H4M2_9HYPH|nr:DeoR/GlpR family DNA-binding transcription regulator [Methylobrevis pamukkalensis]ODN71262.1 HTH-type transcriptional regulator UlaR [Methylobrevis pamukkalensis]